MSASRGARIGLAALAFSALTVATLVIAHPRVFTGFAAYDDEGYVLTSLKSFVHHGSLYDDVFSQYGPFYYEFWGGLFSTFGIAVTHDAGRTATMAAWVLASLGIGLATARLTANVLLGLAGQVLAFAVIHSLTKEPMHPGGLICLLLAVILLIACAVRARPSPRAMGLLGAAVAALILVKINVGAFALAALALICAVSYPLLAGRRWLRPLVEAGFVAIPPLLMLGDLGAGWARRYAAHVAIAALAVVLALRARQVERRPDRELAWLGGGLAAAGLAICLAILATGTSLSGLVEGIVRQPLGQGDAFTLPLSLSGLVYLLDPIGLGCAFAYARWARGRDIAAGDGWPPWLCLFSLAAGAAIWLSLIGRALPFDPATGFPLSMLAFAWVALVPAPEESPATAFARLLVVPLAVLQGLHAFPVAGSQVGWSAFLLVPVGAICVVSGLRGLARLTAERAELGRLRALGAGLVAILAAALIAVGLRHNGSSYDSLVPLDLPGAEFHVGPTEVVLFHQISDEIDSKCTALLTLPGMDSFYLWTQQEPPTGFNATAWPTLFDDAHQQRVIDETRSIRGLCLLENASLAEYWSPPGPPPGPLVRYLHHGFEPVAEFGSYKLRRRTGEVPNY